MKKAVLVGSVVAAHVALIGGVILIQGCGTPQPPVTPAKSEVVMPPAVEPPPPAPVVEPPVVLPPAKPIEKAPAATKTYTIKAGDSLSLIAKRFNVSTRDLMKANKITDANKIRVGQKLTLPGYVNLNAPAPVAKKKATAATKKPAGASKAAAPAAAGEYVVKSGDSLAKIAHKHGTTVAALKQANNLSSDNLKIGQKLVLGGGAAAKPAAPAVEQGAAPVAPEGAPAVEPGAGQGAAPLPEPKANEVLHVVEPNQDLNSIAMMYGVRAEDLMKQNNLSSPDVKVGQTLKIPPPTE